MKDKEATSDILLNAIASMKDKIAKIELDKNISDTHKSKQLGEMRKSLRETQKAAVWILYKELGALLRDE